MFTKLVFNPNLTFSEKLELLYLSPYYLQAFFFLVGTLSWLISEAVFPARLPFWTSLWGWSLVLTNFISLPLLNAVGLFLEESEEKDYLGLISFFALTYILVPFQAYSALKGFLEGKEGPWFRTPKTGRITDIIRRGTFYRFIAGILPGRAAAISPIKANNSQILANDIRLNSHYLALATANNQFSSFKISKKSNRWIGKVTLVLVLISAMLLHSMIFRAQPVQAAWLSGWEKRVQITVSHANIDSDLTNFPLMLELGTSVGTASDDVSFIFDELTSDANRLKIAVTGSDGTTEHYVEIELWDDASETAILWVSSSSLTLSGSSDTTLYLYYDAAHADNTTYVGDTNSSAADNVWDGSYIGVFHLDERPDTDDGCSSNNACDSAGSFDGAFSSGMTSADRVSAKIGNGTDFDGTGDYVPMGFNTEVDNLYATSGNAWSVSAWFAHPNEITADQVVVGRGGGTGSAATYNLYIESSDDDIRSIIRGTQTDGAVNGDDAAWHFGSTTWDGTSGALAIDGGEISMSIGTATQQTSTIIIGATNAGASNLWIGQVDEVRFSDTARSSAWVKADYYSTNDGLVDWGTEEIPELVVLLLPLALISPLIVKYLDKRRRLATLQAELE